MSLICFDLDGTLLDPVAGFQRSLAFVCEEEGIPVPGRAAIARSIGLDPALLFAGLPAGRADALLQRFWQHFGEEGYTDQRVHDGVHLMLERLKRQDHRLHAVANQPVSLVRRMLHHFDMYLLFEDVAGLAAGEPWQPKERIMEALRQTGTLEPGGCLIGDRADDVRAARAHGLRAVGVAYGFGGAAELEEARADLILDSLGTLDAWLEKEWQGPEIHDPFSRSE